MNNNKTILIDGVRYHKDRPASCRQCYFWKNRKAGCSLGKENCYYLAESPKKKNPCEGCCYGPCVSSCMKKVLGQKEVPALSVLSAGVPVPEVSVCSLPLWKGP